MTMISEIESESTEGTIAEAATRLQGASAQEILACGLELTGGDLVVTSSFSDSILVDVAVKVAPEIEVVFLDTGSSFPETLAYVEALRKRYKLNLKVVRPSPEAMKWACGTERCCELRKVEPLRSLLADRAGWATGVRRVETPERAGSEPVELDSKFSVVKVNPLVYWDDDEVNRYAEENELLSHPLSSKGYVSIGCAPVTVPVQIGQSPREGRWPGSEKTECGLHI